MTTETQWLDKLKSICPELNTFIFPQGVRMNESKIQPCPIISDPPPPCHGVGSHARVWHLLSHANDWHNWTFEQIAEWLEQQEQYDLEVIS